MILPRYKVAEVDGDRSQEWHVEDILDVLTVTRIHDGATVPYGYQTVCVCYNPDMAARIARLLNEHQEDE